MSEYRESTLKDRAEAVKMVIETSGPIADFARDLRISDGTLRNWMDYLA